MASYSFENIAPSEIAYNRSQVIAFERWRHTTDVMTINPGFTTGILPYITALPGSADWWPYKIAGSVKDVNDDPVVGADVYLLKGDNRGLHVIRHTSSNASGGYSFYVEDDDTEYLVVAWFWDAGLGEYIRGVTDRDLKAVAA